MGQQQLLLIILGVIIVGIAIAVGIAQFSAHSNQSNKDGVTSNLVNVAANAYQYKIRPSTMGGGAGSYTNYILPTKMSTDDNGNYSLGATSSTSVQIVGTSKLNTAWTATCTADDSGRTSITYSGW
jgi:type II secretory pathway pseudopilin PulG